MGSGMSSIFSACMSTGATSQPGAQSTGVVPIAPQRLNEAPPTSTAFPPEQVAGTALTPQLVTRKRKSLFESTDEEGAAASSSASPAALVLEEAIKNLLAHALALHFGVDPSTSDYQKLELFASCMRREEFNGGVTVLTEGQVHPKLYVVECGYVQISVRSAFIKTVGKGSVLGDLSMKEEELRPLQSTAHCITKAVLWSLTREDMRKAEFTSSSEQLLKDALFEYFGIEENSAERDKIAMFVSSMEREEIKGGTTLIAEGDIGSKLYIIDAGYYQISVKGQYIRTIGRGKVLGDLALLYDAPRSASAHSITDSVVWSLRRETFRQINIRSSSSDFKRRAKWLIHCPALAALSVVNFTRLINSFQTKVVEPDTALFTARTLATDCVLVESGRALVYVPSEDLVGRRTAAELDEYLGISRPQELHRRLSRDLADFINSSSGSGSVSNGVGGSGAQEEQEKEKDSLGAEDVSLELRAEPLVQEQSADGFYVCEVYEGCVLGTGALRQDGPDTEDLNAWKATNRTWKFEDGSWHALQTGFGCHAPFTVRCVEQMKVSAFAFETFERLLETPDPVQIDDEKDESRSEKSLAATIRSESADTRSPFDVTMFTANYVLGKGSFGIVLFATMKVGVMSEHFRQGEPPLPLGFALKIYDKKDVASNVQLKNVIHSANLLRKLSSPFVMKLYGTFQTQHQLYMVCEPLLHGSLWDVITGGPFFKGGLPMHLVKFYVASIAYALAHVHSSGAGYRELKPENVMLDSSGYVRLIDFGMCKRIPYTKTDSRGNTKVYSKSYTLFGTPEYLSPEQVFNLGHDFGVDIWALGVVMFELIMGCTPFAPTKPDNLPELFANIANAKKSGLPIPENFSAKSKDPHAQQLIQRLLEYESTDRIGVKEGSTSVILTHPYFDGFDLNALKSCEMLPPYIPAPSAFNEPLFNLPGVKRYRGDQKLFDTF